MNSTSIHIPLDAPLRQGTHPDCICASCKHIAADWQFCKPLISESDLTTDGYKIVVKCTGYEIERENHERRKSSHC